MNVRLPGSPTAKSRRSTLSGPSEAASRVEAAARQLFYERGYLATSIRDLATACGVTPAAIYNHTPSKHALLFSIIRATHEELDDLLFNAVVNAGPDSPDQLASLVTSFVDYNCKHPDMARVTNREYRQLPAELLLTVLGLRRRLRGLFVNLLLRGVDKGEFAIPGGTSSVPIRAMAIINMCILAAEYYNPRGPLSVDELAAEHADMALRMVLPPTGSS